MIRRTRAPRRTTGSTGSTGSTRPPAAGSAMLRLAVAGAGSAAAVAVAVAAPTASAHEGGHDTGSTTAAAHSRDGAGRAMAELKRTLRPYQDVTVAQADGFFQVSDCVESPAGGMGIHFLNPVRAMAPVDATKPSMLLYAPTDDGGLRLVGAEWFQADADQDLSTDADRPTLWGRPFEGPMPGHEPGMPIHYDLHVWLFEANPAGVFAGWNPAISC